MPIKNFFVYLMFFTQIFILSPRLKAQDQSLPYPIENLVTITFNSSINPSTLEYLKSAQLKAREEKYSALLIKLNTPGGLVSITKDILTHIGQENYPTIVWITPEGASATSAGAIIASGAHVLFMQRGSNIGAATPVQMGKDIADSDLRNKAINDLVALVEGLSEARNRSGKHFALMISKAKSYSAEEALKLNITDGIVNTHEELLAALDGKVVQIKDKLYQFSTTNTQVADHPMSAMQEVINVFSNPALAYILFILGAALIYIELQVPGGFIAGSVGAICLLMAAIAFQVLPINFGALGLLILSFILFILEGFVTSYGLLSIAGLASLVLGSLLLYQTDNSYLELGKTVIFSSIGAISLFLLFILFFILRDLKNKPKGDLNIIVGKKAKIVDLLGPTEDDLFHYQVTIHGEIWKAKGPNHLKKGEYALVKQLDNVNLILVIQ